MPKAPCSNSFLAWGRAVQQWMRDRDLLVEETLEFVQRVATGSPVRIETAEQATEHGRHATNSQAER